MRDDRKGRRAAWFCIVSCGAACEVYVPLESREPVGVETYDAETPPVGPDAATMDVTDAGPTLRCDSSWPLDTPTPVHGLESYDIRGIWIVDESDGRQTVYVGRREGTSEHLERAVRTNPNEPLADWSPLPNLNLEGNNVDPAFVNGYLYFTRYSTGALDTAATYVARRTDSGTFEPPRPMTEPGLFGAKPVPKTTAFLLNGYRTGRIRLMRTEEANGYWRAPSELAVAGCDTDASYCKAPFVGPDGTLYLSRVGERPGIETPYWAPPRADAGYALPLRVPVLDPAIAEVRFVSSDNCVVYLAQPTPDGQVRIVEARRTVGAP